MTLVFVSSFFSCTKEESDAEKGTGNGMANLKLSVTVQGAVSSRQSGTETYDALASSTMKVYKVEDGAEGKVESLIRKYRPATEAPSDLYLVAGTYKVTVEAGTGAEATFVEKTYRGEQEVTLVANQVKPVQIVCKVTNIAVKVTFDETVRNAFDKSFKAYVCASDAFSKEDALSARVPVLKYEDDSTGFFILPEDVSNLSWGFEGTSSDEDINRKGSMSGVIENPQPGMQYNLGFRYSKDADGYITVDVNVREYEEEYDDNFVFTPKPTFGGDGFSISEVCPYTGSDISFSISSISSLDRISVKVPGQDQAYVILEGGVPSAQAEGISYEAIDEFSGKITFSSSFVSSFPSGINSMEFSATDTSSETGDATGRVAVPGPVGISSEDLWFGKATVNAVITDPATEQAQIKFREAGTEQWNEYVLSAGKDYMYSVEIPGVTADKTYEIVLVENGEESGPALSVKTITGVQLPNADFEEWHTSGKADYPYASGGQEFWGTGNPGSTTMGREYNLTSGADDPRPGSSGLKAARLETKKPSMMGIGKLAAGNIFVGSFGAVSGMGGYVNMGREFDFNARPKALRIWYKYTPAGSDKGRVFVCLVNMDGSRRTHVVNTNSPDQTTFQPSDEFLYTDKTNAGTLEGHIIAYGDLMLETVVGEWAMVEIPITYRENYEDERPNMLMVTASASYRGDYFEGEVGSTMFLDDVEFVY